jgi:hypothetical protein
MLLFGLIFFSAVALLLIVQKLDIECSNSENVNTSSAYKRPAAARKSFSGPAVSATVASGAR